MHIMFISPTVDTYYNLTKKKMYHIEKVDDDAIYFYDDNGKMTFVSIDEFPKSFEILYI